MASNTRYVLSWLVYSVSPRGCLKDSTQNHTPDFSSLFSKSVLPVWVNANHILSTFLVNFDFSRIRTSDQSTNPVSSTFQTHLESDHFSLPPLLMLWSEPPSFLIWITAVLLFLSSSPLSNQSLPFKTWVRSYCISVQSLLMVLPISLRVKSKGLAVACKALYDLVSSQLSNVSYHLCMHALFQPQWPPLTCLRASTLVFSEGTLSVWHLP